MISKSLLFSRRYRKKHDTLFPIMIHTIKSSILGKKTAKCTSIHTCKDIQLNLGYHWTLSRRFDRIVTSAVCNQMSSDFVYFFQRERRENVIQWKNVRERTSKIAILQNRTLWESAWHSKQRHFIFLVNTFSWICCAQCTVGSLLLARAALLHTLMLTKSMEFNYAVSARMWASLDTSTMRNMRSENIGTNNDHGNLSLSI